jgi:hypothetical protein
VRVVLAHNESHALEICLLGASSRPDASKRAGRTMLPSSKVTQLSGTLIFRVPAPRSFHPASLLSLST